jgi:hypothetical protein
MAGDGMSCNRLRGFGSGADVAGGEPNPNVLKSSENPRRA